MSRSLFLSVLVLTVGCGATGEPDDAARAPNPQAPGPEAPTAVATLESTAAPPATSSRASLPEHPAAPSASVASREVAFDVTKISCGQSTCEAGREACCETLDDSGSKKIDRCVKSPIPSEGLVKPGAVFFANCKEKNDFPHYTVVTRCEASDHCGKGQMCCDSVEDTFFYSRCLAFTDAMAKAGRGACPGFERCRPGVACRTPGSTCVGGRCIKAPKAPDHACDTAADCLVGQRCLHPQMSPPVCTAFPNDYREPCEKDETCKLFCGDPKGRCKRPRAVGKSAAPEDAACECP